jgi:methylmalonyl-CoA/ethylmalonyl-CoA epimerase
MSQPQRKGAQLAHVGIALTALDALLPFLRDVLRMPEVDMADSDGAKIRALAAGESLVELLEPDVPGTPIDRFLKRRGPGVHHLCFSVDDLDETLERCREAGIEIVGTAPRRGAEGKLIAFLHPKSTAGILIELSEK